MTVTDLNSLVIFAKVIEAKSFSEAARRLKMPISTVSRRIAELEDELGVRLLERSTRTLRLTAVGTEVLEQARRSAELGEEVANIVSNQLSSVSGLLRISAPPSISDTLIAPLIVAFQASYPNVSVQVFVTERHVDHIAEEFDLVFRFGHLKDSSLVARKILTYRHQLVASPAYLARCKLPETPQDLLGHRLIGFLKWTAEDRWDFEATDSGEKATVSFQPHFSINDYAGMATALIACGGIGDLPPLVRPELLRTGQLVEIMPNWHFPSFDLRLVHVVNRHISRPVRVFSEFAAQMAPVLFPHLPN